jgi:SAM-dependent methyltransferase
MFNNIYKTTKPGFATQPNALLVSNAEGHKPGRALDVGMGQGRNSIFLALKGWDVTGFDMSDEGIAADVIVEAVSVAKALGWRAPVKLQWTREDDMRGGRYRPIYVHSLKAGLDAEGRLIA